MFRKERYHHKHCLAYVRRKEDEEFVVVTKHKRNTLTVKK